MGKLPKEPPSREITPEAAYKSRRDFIKNAALTAGTAAMFGTALHLATNRRKSASETVAFEKLAPPPAAKLVLDRSPFDTDEPQNTFTEITTFNNFYEFGTSKSDPAARAHTLKPRPWTVAITGEVEKEMRLDIDDVLKMADQQQRIYRMRR